MKVKLMYLFFYILTIPVYSSTLSQEEIELALQGYRNSIELFKDISMKMEMELWNIDSTDLGNKKNSRMISLGFRRDNGNTEWVGNEVIFNNNNEKEIAYVVDEIGTETLSMRAYPFFNEKRAIISPPSQERQMKLLNHPSYGSMLWGRIFGNGNNNLIELFDKCSDVKGSHTSIGGNDCVLIEGSNKYGTFKLWVSPERKYNAIKWTIEKKSDNFFDKKTILDLGVSKWKATFEATDFLKINEAFLAKNGRVSLSRTDLEGRQSTTIYTSRIIDVQLSPDFKALEAFTLKSFNLPRGSIVKSDLSPGIKYRWNGDKLVAEMDEFILDAIENTVPELKKESLFEKQEQHKQEDENPTPSIKMPKEFAVPNAEKSHTVDNSKTIIISIGFTLLTIIGLASVLVIRLRRNRNEKE